MNTPRVSSPMFARRAPSASPWHTSALRAAGWVTVLGLIAGIGGAFAPAAASQSREAVELTESGVELLGEQKLDEAVARFDEAIEKDESYWEAWYQRGRALAMMGRMEEGMESLLQSTVLNPGHAHSHQLAALAAQNVENYEIAWDQAIRAYLAGADPQEVFGGLSARSPQPPDFDERVAAWRVYVAGIDTSDLLASAQQPTNGGGTVEQTLGQIQAELNLLQRHVANALSSARGFGLVQQPEQAQYFLTIAPDEIDADPRASMDGYLRLYHVDSPQPIYFRPVSFRDLASAGAVRSELERLVAQMENWRQTQQH